MEVKIILSNSGIITSSFIKRSFSVQYNSNLYRKISRVGVNLPPDLYLREPLSPVQTWTTSAENFLQQQLIVDIVNSKWKAATMSIVKWFEMEGWGLREVEQGTNMTRQTGVTFQCAIINRTPRNNSNDWQILLHSIFYYAFSVTFIPFPAILCSIFGINKGIIYL